MASCNKMSCTIPIRRKFLYVQSPLCGRPLFARDLTVHLIMEEYLIVATALDLIPDFVYLFLNLQCVKKTVIHKLFEFNSSI